MNRQKPKGFSRSMAANFFTKNRSVLVFGLVFVSFFVVLPTVFAQSATTPLSQAAQSAPIADNNWLVQAVNWLLYWVYYFFSMLVSLAATIFLWVIDTNVFSGLMNNAAIYEVWRTVRDFCNIFFILVLLFSAFATIFQLERYEWKKTVPLLIIMALLVNFSFPISRFVIDLANVPMYFFAQNVSGGANQITKDVLSQSKIQEIILPGINSGSQAADAPFPQMVAAVICMFLFGISFLVLAVLMLIRMIALAMLVMFSPIGFVGMITPALSKFASDWWNKLFKWAFYGPISVMLVLIAIKVMQAGSQVQAANPMQNLTGQDWLSSFLSSIAFFAIPIVLFWIAITQAEKYSGDMSGMSVRFGSQLGRWGSRTLTGYNWGMRRYGAYSAERKRRADAKLADSMFGARLGRLVNSTLDRARSSVPIGSGSTQAKNRRYQEDIRLVDEAGKRLNVSNLGGDELRKLANSGGRGERGAALKELAMRGNADRTDLANIRSRFGHDSQVVRDFESKMRAFDPVAVFTDSSGKLNSDRLESFVKSNQFDPKKVVADSLTPELLRFAFEAKNISVKDLDELQSKGAGYKKAIQDSLDTAISSISAELVAAGKDWDMDDDFQRNIQMANLAQTGKFHGSVAGTSAIAEAAREKMFKRADADTLKRLDIGELTPKNLELMGKNMGAKYVDVIAKMAENNLATAAQINTHMRGYTGTDANTLRIKGLTSDHRIRHI